MHVDMALFSERYGYVKVSDVIIRERITPEIQNAICTCFDKLEDYYRLEGGSYTDFEYIELEKYVWTKFLNQRLAYYHSDDDVLVKYIEDSDNAWFQKLDLIEFSIKSISRRDDFYKTNVAERFIKRLNSEFERLNYAYRIVGEEVVEITSEQEIETVETAMNNSPRNIQLHLNSALEKYAQRPIGDYRNSIKESISAVECYCREITEENTLGKALNKLKGKGVVIPNLLISAFEKLYAYTNQGETGIRHALMDNDENYTPTAEEAFFMLVSCSAFINYLSRKVK